MQALSTNGCSSVQVMPISAVSLLRSAVSEKAGIARRSDRLCIGQVRKSRGVETREKRCNIVYARAEIIGYVLGKTAW
jgi:hypothetical protein